MSRLVGVAALKLCILLFFFSFLLFSYKARVCSVSFLKKEKLRERETSRWEKIPWVKEDIVTPQILLQF